MGSVRKPGVRPLTWVTEAGQPASTEVTGLTDLDAALAFMTAASAELRAALYRYGAIYLRGLPITDVEAFGLVRDVLMPSRTPYREKATPRSDYGNDVHSSTDLPASQSIRMHNENSYTLTFPGLLMFACLVAPPEGGATPVADCRAVLRALPPPLVARVREIGWLLNRCYSEDISTDWQTAFGTSDRTQVARYCAENLITCDWADTGRLRTRQLRPGVISHPVTGDDVWFNHLAFWNEWALDEELRETLLAEFGHAGLPFNTAFGDDTSLSRDELAIIDAAYAKATVRRPWEPGDLLLVDNILSGHGRDPFRGDRTIVVAMGEPVRLADCDPTVPARAPRIPS